MKKTQNISGFTLTELMLTIGLSALLVTAVGVVMVETQRGWVDTYAKVHGGASADAMMTKTAFDRIVRKASRSVYQVDAADDITVYYYNDWLTSTYLDRYSRFYRSTTTPSEMYIENGTVDILGNQTRRNEILLASNVVDLEFQTVGGGIEMKLALDDGREATTVVTAAILHNE